MIGCTARPHAEDERTCELPSGHETPLHKISGMAADKFGEHAWSVTWHDGSYGVVAVAWNELEEK